MQKNIPSAQHFKVFWQHIKILKPPGQAEGWTSGRDRVGDILSGAGDTTAPPPTSAQTWEQT